MLRSHNASPEQPQENKQKYETGDPSQGWATRFQRMKRIRIVLSDCRSSDQTVRPTVPILAPGKAD